MNAVGKYFRGWLPAIFALLAWSAMAAESGGASAASLRVVDLKCGYAVDPLGVDAPQPSLSWRLESAGRGQRQTAWQIVVAASAQTLAEDRGELWDSGRVAGDQTTQIGYAGEPLHSSQQVFWKVRAWDRDGRATAWSAPATWTMGVLRPEDWTAHWIAAKADCASLLLRREFTVKAGVKRALLHVTGLGQYEARLNGAKVGEDLLSPGWTNYRRTVLYDTHDVTASLREGDNALGLTLGSGMYRVERPAGRFAKFTGSFGPLRAIAQLEIEYADGTRSVVGTDDAWRTRPGPITFSSIYGGEDFDARWRPAGWDRAGFDAAGWAEAVVTNDPVDVLRGQSHASEPLRAIETREPISRRKLADGAELFDFGQNASFMPRLRVSGPAGSTVTLTPGEVANADGAIERGTMGGAHRGSAWWSYTKATDGEEEWFPQFYYVGSRYLRTTTASAKPDGAQPRIEALQMTIVHAGTEPLGSFATSNPLLNRIHELVRWAQRSNMVSILTDCPHREKLGWIEQYHLNGPSIRYEFDVTRIYAKGMADMAEAQTPDGLVPNIAPEYVQFKGAFRDAAEWGAAFVLVPWQQYEFTGDASLLRDYYEPMKRYFAHLESAAKGDVLANGLGDWYDYVIGGGKRANLTPAPITATAFFHEDARRLAAAAKLLGRTGDAAHYSARAEEIRRAYVRNFRRPDGLYGTASQASLAIPLALGLVESEDRAGVVAALVKDVEEKGYASAGDIGFRFLLRALAEAGRSDVIYRLIDQDEEPGYGYQLKHGATALTESWHASLGASQNHFMLGQIIEWFYADLAGIAPDPAEPGFKRILVRPQPVGDLRWVEATYRSVHGPITVKWQREHGTFRLRVEIPANTTATVYVPLTAADAPVTESGKTAEKQRGVTALGREPGGAVYRIEAGSYIFETKG